jgi:hypothetical protein
MLSATISGLDAVTARLNALSSAAAVVGAAYATVGTDLSYARMVHDGTRAHEIAPINKRALAWPGGQHPVAHVHHPGYKGNPFLTGALSDKAGAVTTRLAAAMEAVAAGAPGGTLAAALLDAALIVQGEAQRRVNVKTGSLRRSLHSELFGR